MRLYGDVSDDVMFLPSRRRAYSVGGDSDDYTTPGVFPVSRQALRITSHAMDDSDVLSAASSRKDRNLLKDITSKMEAVQYGRPIPNEIGRRSYRTVGGGSAALRTVTPHTLLGSISPLVARRASIASYAPASSALRYARALSVQPRRTFLDDVTADDYLDYGYSSYSLPPKRRMYTERRRSAIRAMSEPPAAMRSSASEFAVKQARNRLSRYEPIGVYSTTIRSSSLPRAGSRPIIAPSSSAASRARIAALEAKYDSSLDPYDMPTASLSTIRSQTTDIRNRMDTQRTLLDRYLPVYLGPESEVEDNIMHKYSELVESPSAAAGADWSAQRMPSLDPYRPTSGVGSGSATPTKRTPSNSSNYMGPSYRPQVSDVRKRVREVLCRTKRDPRYFDY